jgi:hypothetical protein
MAELNTYGDLKQAIKTIQLKQKGEKIGNVALDVVLNNIPGLGAAKTTFDFLKAAFSKPDTKKTKTWLDKIDVDDEVSAIVDDTVENNFLKTMAQMFDSEQDDAPLEQDFNMNQKMVDYLKKEYGGRTVTGIKEFEMKDRFQKLAGIKEETATPTTTTTTKQTMDVTAISKDLEDRESNFKNINTKDKMVQLLDTIVSKLDPKFAESTNFKAAILAFYNKHK